MNHAIGGLTRVGLLDDSFLGHGEVVRVTPSIMGLELYGWAQGLPALPARGFAAKAQLFEITDAIPRPRSVSFPKLPQRAEATVQPVRRQLQTQRQVRRAR
jgi:hypothetical protein